MSLNINLFILKLTHFPYLIAAFEFDNSNNYIVNNQLKYDFVTNIILSI